MRRFRLTHLLDDPLYLVSLQPGQRLEDHRGSAWGGGCERCREALIAACGRAGFSPRIAYSSDDMVVIQSLVASGMGGARFPDSRSRRNGRPGSTPQKSPTTLVRSMPSHTATHQTPGHHRADRDSAGHGVMPQVPPRLRAAGCVRRRYSRRSPP
ncbi:LysR substrate-binding domain-containing protein [Thermocatellispora tengchongensis]|uniref:LysR substrate-binding domain-containing protein n=1 Tax=Thermocatellispora tengchongensis TaxID=1073253 RepID=UPI0035E41013